RGLKGGLSFAGVAMVDVFGRLGYDKVFIESIGVGQADIDIMGIAHTILVVTVPGLGDDIQALKAGVMEIGDIYVINKVDKNPEEANKSYEYLKFAIESGEIGVDQWLPRIIKVSAVMCIGIDKLVETMDEHLNYLMNTKKYWDKQVIRSKVLVRLLAEKMVLDAIDDLPLPEKYDNIYLEARNILKKVMDYIGNGVNHSQQD
ncbi:TPA: methylmalonyl Co-A mutase-associated GTPase MeaB, partial [Candidatus Geothermarchaeota archaeon]|nr:methylmalonyl Co-A mutase-associated GTPase MeaB [Candidatus Geothermarchaeota archaeon]